MEKQLLKYPKNTESPFIGNMFIKTRGKSIAISRKAMQIADKDTGEIDDQVFMYIRKEIDQEQFIKVFRGQLQALFDLSKTAGKICGYFMNALRINEDLVLFDLKECVQQLGYKTHVSVYNGLAELLNKQFIARGKNPNSYYINPEMFFNGNRLVVIQDYWLKKSPKEMEIDGQTDMFAGGKTNREIKQLQKLYNKAK